MLASIALTARCVATLPILHGWDRAGAGTSVDIDIVILAVFWLAVALLAVWRSGGRRT